MYGCYIECNRCKMVTLGGEQVTKNPEQPLRRALFDGAELRRRARERGWIQYVTPGTTSGISDACPACARDAMRVTA